MLHRLIFIPHSQAIGNDQVAIGSVGGVILVTPHANKGIRALSAQFASEVQEGVSAVMKGNVRDITIPVGATLIGAGVAMLAVLMFVFRRGHALVSPRLPTRS